MTTPQSDYYDSNGYSGLGRHLCHVYLPHQQTGPVWDVEVGFAGTKKTEVVSFNSEEKAREFHSDLQNALKAAGDSWVPRPHSDPPANASLLGGAIPIPQDEVERLRNKAEEVSTKGHTTGNWYSAANFLDEFVQRVERSPLTVPIGGRVAQRLLSAVITEDFEPINPKTPKATPEKLLGSVSAFMHWAYHEAT